MIKKRAISEKKLKNCCLNKKDEDHNFEIKLSTIKERFMDIKNKIKNEIKQPRKLKNKKTKRTENCLEKENENLRKISSVKIFTKIKETSSSNSKNIFDLMGRISAPKNWKKKIEKKDEKIYKISNNNKEIFDFVQNYKRKMNLDKNSPSPKKFNYKIKNKDFIKDINKMNFLKMYGNEKGDNKNQQILSHKKIENSPQPRLSSKGKRNIISINPMLDKVEKEHPLFFTKKNNKNILFEKKLKKLCTDKIKNEEPQTDEFYQNWNNKHSCKKLNFSQFQNNFENKKNQFCGKEQSLPPKPHTSNPKLLHKNENNCFINYINNNINLNVISSSKFQNKDLIPCFYKNELFTLNDFQKKDYLHKKNFESDTKKNEKFNQNLETMFSQTTNNKQDDYGKDCNENKIIRSNENLDSQKKIDDQNKMGKNNHFYTLSKKKTFESIPCFFENHTKQIQENENQYNFFKKSKNNRLKSTNKDSFNFTFGKYEPIQGMF